MARAPLCHLCPVDACTGLHRPDSQHQRQDNGQEQHGCCNGCEYDPCEAGALRRAAIATVKRADDARYDESDEGCCCDKECGERIGGAPATRAWYRR